MLSCPLCSRDVAESGDELESHLREDLDYFPWRCRICKAEFSSFPSLQLHFSGPFSRHANTKPKYTEKIVLDLDRRLMEALKTIEARNSVQSNESQTTDNPAADPDESNAPNQEDDISVSKDPEESKPTNYEDDISDTNHKSFETDSDEERSSFPSLVCDVIQESRRHTSESPEKPDDFDSAETQNPYAPAPLANEATEMGQCALNNSLEPVLDDSAEHANDDPASTEVGLPEIEIPDKENKGRKNVRKHGRKAKKKSHIEEGKLAETEIPDIVMENKGHKNVRKRERKAKIKLPSKSDPNTVLTICKLCRRKFSWPHREGHVLKYHIKEPQFPCTFCDAEYRMATGITWHAKKTGHLSMDTVNHMVKNTRIRLMSELETLYEHCAGDNDRTQLGKLPCRICNRLFVWNNREGHVRSYHLEEPSFSCPCGHRFRNLSSLRYHARKNGHLNETRIAMQNTLKNDAMKDELEDWYNRCLGKEKDQETIGNISSLTCSNLSDEDDLDRLIPAMEI